MSEANRRGPSNEVRTRRARKRVRGGEPPYPPDWDGDETLAHEQGWRLDEV